MTHEYSIVHEVSRDRPAPSPDDYARLLKENADLRAKLERRAMTPEEKDESDKLQIVEHLRGRSQRTAHQISEALFMAPSRVNRLLADMRKQKSVQWVGCWSAHAESFEDAGD